jgi:alcohol dehydrogenase YqhD (iron-dependent ADH family)
MIDFDFRNPTRIIFGKKSEDKIADLLVEYGYKRVLIVYGGGSIVRSGLLSHVLSLLDDKKIFHTELGGITPNPSKEFSIKGVELAKNNKIEALLAIGGGSVIDVAKSIGVGFYYSGDPFDFNMHKVVATKTLPVTVILTIASAGSESSNSCVISDPVAHIKNGFNNDLIRPVFAIEDPELTYSVPSRQLSAGIADIMMHSLERFLNPSDDNQLSDSWALELCKNVMKAGKKAIEDPHDYEARASLMLASSLSHDGLTSIGKTSKFIIHPLEHAISGYHSDVTHGVGVAIVYLGFAKFTIAINPAKFATIARVLFNINTDNQQKTAIMGVEAMRDFYISIGLPVSLREVGIKDEDLDAIADLASGNGTRVVGSYPQPLDRKAILEIYRNCLG